MEIKKRKYISIFFILAFFFASVILAISSCYNEVDIDSFPSSKLTSIQITNMPDKLVYQMHDTLDTSGLIITASYKSGNQKEIPQKVEGVEVGWVTKGFDSTQHVSQQTVFITYEENGISRFTSYTITYKNLTAISITTVPDKKFYQMGDSLDTTGMEITASYEDGTSGLIALNDPNLTFSGFDSSVNVSSQTIYVTYKTNNGQRSAQFTIQYKNLSGIAVTTKPEKDHYFTGDTFDSTGMVVTASYADGTRETIPLTDANLKITGFNSAAGVASPQTITVTYTAGNLQYSDSFYIYYKTLVGLTIKTPPNNLVYLIGEELDLEGLVLTASYQDGSTDEVNYDDSGISWSSSGNFTTGNPASQTITLTYGGRSVQYGINFKVLNSIAITTPASKTTYTSEDTQIDLTGLVVTATFTDNTTEIVGHGELTVTGFNPSANVSSQVIYLSYGSGNYIRTVSYTITYKNLASITVTTPPTKLKYKQGEEFDYTGIVVTASYTDGSTSVIDNSILIFTGFNSSENVQSQNITVTYTLAGVSRATQFTIMYTDIASISILVPAKKTIYNMKEDIQAGTISDISEWTLDTTDMEFGLNALNGSVQVIKADNANLTYSGFDPTSFNSTQTISVTYNDGSGTKRVTQFNITIKYEPAYSLHEVIAPAGDHYTFGDWPQTIKADSVKISSNHTYTAGMFTYYLGSDGNYYVKCQGNPYSSNLSFSNGTTIKTGTEYYFKVEPIPWKSLGYGEYMAKIVLKGGIPWAQTTSTQVSGRKEAASEPTVISDCSLYYYRDSITRYYPLCYFQLSTPSDFLNGTTMSGTSTYSSKGVLQSAFTNSAQEKLIKKTLTERSKHITERGYSPQTSDSLSTDEGKKYIGISNVTIWNNPIQKAYMYKTKDYEISLYLPTLMDYYKVLVSSTDYALANYYDASSGFFARNPGTDDEGKEIWQDNERSTGEIKWIADGSKGVGTILYGATCTDDTNYIWKIYAEDSRAVTKYAKKVNSVPIYIDSLTPTTTTTTEFTKKSYGIVPMMYAP